MNRLKRWSSDRLLSLLCVTGISPGAGRELLNAIWTFKRTLVLVFLFSLAQPLLELSFIGSLYILLSEERQLSVLTTLRAYGLGTVFGDLCVEGMLVYVISGTAGVLLLLRVGMKLVHRYVLAKLYYTTYVKYAHRLLSAYVNTPPMRVLTLDKNRVANAIIAEAGQFGNAAVQLLSMISDVSSALFLFLSAGVLSPLLLVASGGVGVCMFLMNRRGYWKARAIGARKVKAQSNLLGHIFDILSGFRSIKLEGAERRVLDRSNHYLRSNMKWRFDHRWNASVVSSMSEGFVLVALFAVIFTSAVVLRLDVAFLMTFMIIISRLQNLSLSAQAYWMKIKRTIPSLELVHNLFSTCGQAQNGEERDTGLQQSGPESPLTVRLEGVGFRYPEGEWILQDVSLTLQPGDRVLIQGGSGEGKSTLMLLLTGLLMPTKGHIFYNNRLFDEQAFYQERRKIAYAASDVHLFRDSIRENLLLAGNLSESEIQDAVRKARLQDVLANLDGGLDGFIGENGSNLSLGERQRVMLARVFLKQPHLVLLDEATNNLDLGLEEDILEDLKRNLAADSILIMIAHRKPRNTQFNREFLLKYGRIQEV